MAQGTLGHNSAERKHGRATVLELDFAAARRVELERVEFVVSWLPVSPVTIELGHNDAHVFVLANGDKQQQRPHRSVGNGDVVCLERFDALEFWTRERNSGIDGDPSRERKHAKSAVLDLRFTQPIQVVLGSEVKRVEQVLAIEYFPTMSSSAIAGTAARGCISMPAAGAWKERLDAATAASIGRSRSN
eukprot:CAMPEP_0113268134 /NCGR_PEP_ID=MMETSP0008_2-20120614/20993_1 /TAXON_ID=97485 /ORGANISM="Prymnesium parvum" /LENGTH=188 /DNA_ID=CAMNT_0000117239 /DNA_START=239 /DNA_END=806 /DNA_ORIENTATION=- /assembly_acc=CAM_ASM_000153